MLCGAIEPLSRRRSLQLRATRPRNAPRNAVRCIVALACRRTQDVIISRKLLWSLSPFPLHRRSPSHQFGFRDATVVGRDARGRRTTAHARWIGVGGDAISAAVKTNRQSVSSPCLPHYLHCLPPSLLILHFSSAVFVVWLACAPPQSSSSTR